MDSHTIAIITIPFFSGAIGYVTNWTGVWMLFNPIRFKGIRVPGLVSLVGLLPRKVQQIPGVMHGGVGWQGIIPSRAAKMGSIAVDKGIAKLGSPSEFYEQLDPEQIADQILVTARRDIRDVVERIMEREHAQLWHDLPPRVREAIHARVEEQLPEIVRSVTDQIGKHVDQLIDIKLMVIRSMEANPELANRVYLEVGERELRFIINFGFFFGFLLGLPTILITEAFPYWWVLPLAGVVIGYTTNWMALWLIFEPVEPHKVGPFLFHGLYLRRRNDVADVYAKIVSEDIVTIGNMGKELLHGPASDRTRQMIETAMRPAVDRAVGRSRAAVRLAVGTRSYDTIRESVAVEAVDYTMTPLQDPEFGRRQGAKVRSMISERMRELPYPDFAEMLRTAMREDEWLLLLHGAVLGFFAGCVHLAIFGVG